MGKVSASVSWPEELKVEIERRAALNERSFAQETIYLIRLGLKLAAAEDAARDKAMGSMLSGAGGGGGKARAAG